MKLQKLAVVAVATALAGMFAGTGAQAAPWQVAPDAPGSAFLLDAGTGELLRCAPRAPSGAKVLDVFGASGEVRPQAARAGEIRCTAVRAAPEDPRAHRIAAIVRARTGTLADLYDARGPAWPEVDGRGIVWPGLLRNQGY